MRQILNSFGALLLAVGLLMLASGLFGTFIGLRTSYEGFTREVVGLMTTGYYAGLIAGTLYCGGLVNRIGHIRAFAAFAAVASAAVMAYSFVVYAPVWIGLRAVIGFNMAGLFMVVESWLNERSTPQTRGTAMSLYMMTSYLAMGGGQFMLNVGDVASFELFMLTAMLFTLALVPVAVTRATHPAPVEASRFGFRRLYEISPTSVIGCAAAGLSSGALFGMGPIYAKDLGLDVSEIAFFMGILVASGLLLQVPVGRLSDRFDRRIVILCVCVAAAASSAALVGFMYWDSYTMMSPAGQVSMVWAEHRELLLLLTALYGGFAATLYPLSVAYANDYIDARDTVAASGGLLLAFGVGAAAGPVGAAQAMRYLGPEGLFIFTAAIAALVVLFTLHRMRRRSWVPVMEKSVFVALPEATTTPVPGELDPRAEETEILEPDGSGDATR